MQIPHWVRGGGGAQAARGQVSFPESPSTSMESPGLVTLGSRRAEMWSLWSQLTREKRLERTHLKRNDWTFSHWFKYNMWETSFPISLPILLLGSRFQSPVVCDNCLSLDSPKDQDHSSLTKPLSLIALHCLPGPGSGRTAPPGPQYHYTSSGHGEESPFCASSHQKPFLAP